MQHSTELVSTSERAFLIGALAEGLRADGRAASDTRSVRILLGATGHSAEVELGDGVMGDTRVIAHVSAELIEPYPDRPTEGTFALAVDLSAMASPAFEVGKPSAQAIELSRVIERAIVKSNAIDLEALCVLPGKKVWAVRCDVTVLDHCGNLMDACILAAGAGLRHFRKPYVRVHRGEDGEASHVEICAEDVEEPEPLALRQVPLGFTFALVQHDESSAPFVILDANEREEAIASGSLSVVLNKQGELCALHTAGGAALDVSQIREAMQIASEKLGALHRALDEAIATRPSTTAAGGGLPGQGAPGALKPGLKSSAAVSVG